MCQLNGQYLFACFCDDFSSKYSMIVIKQSRRQHQQPKIRFFLELKTDRKNIDINNEIVGNLLIQCTLTVRVNKRNKKKKNIFFSLFTQFTPYNTAIQSICILGSFVAFRLIIMNDLIRLDNVIFNECQYIIVVCRKCEYIERERQREMPQKIYYYIILLLDAEAENVDVAATRINSYIL